MALISHDAFARYELHRQTVTPKAGQTCSWCGNLNQKGKLFAYHTEDDASLSRQQNELSGVFCSIGCVRIYHS